MSIGIRHARPDDVDDVRALLLHLAEGFRIPADADDHSRVFAGQLKEPQIDLFVAEDIGEGEPAVAGFLSQRYFTTLALGAEEAYIAELVVHPSARRRGIARALLEHAAEVARARGARLVEVKTHPLRAAARGLYAAAGMSETCIVLELPLSDNARLVVANDPGISREEVVA